MRQRLVGQHDTRLVRPGRKGGPHLRRGRRLCDLFGLSVKAAERYASAVNSLTLPDVTQRVDAGTGAPLQGTDGGMPGAASSIGVDMQP